MTRGIHNSVSNLTFFAVPRLDEGVAFFAGTDFLPANVFFGAGALFALVTADFVAELLAAV